MIPTSSHKLMKNLGHDMVHFAVVDGGHEYPLRDDLSNPSS